MIATFQIFMYCAAGLGLLAAFSDKDALANRAFKIFCAAGTLILCTLLAATLGK